MGQKSRPIRLASDAAPVLRLRQQGIYIWDLCALRSITTFWPSPQGASLSCVLRTLIRCGRVLHFHEVHFSLAPKHSSPFVTIQKALTASFIDSHSAGRGVQVV